MDHPVDDRKKVRTVHLYLFLLTFIEASELHVVPLDLKDKTSIII